MSGRSHEHRKSWVESRLEALANAYCVNVHAYAAMGNHVHVVIEVDPLGPWKWSDEQVAQRWLRVTLAPLDKALFDRRTASLCADPVRINQIRIRLGSLSWFMRHLNEYIARRANKEDDCSGRFWEGRFRAQRLLDDASVLAAMVYVDLNPFRAGMCADPVSATHVSLVRRETLRKPDQALDSLWGCLVEGWRVQLSHRDYRNLVFRTAQRVPETTIDAGTSEQSSRWHRLVASLETGFGLAVGAPALLEAFAGSNGRRWVQGIRLSRMVFAAEVVP